MHATTSSPPLKGMSPADRGGVVLVSAYSWACLSIVAASARFAIMWIRKVQPEADDASFGAALVCRNSPVDPQPLPGPLHTCTLPGQNLA
jgi:hypothetical protein